MEDRHSIVILLLIFAFALMTVQAIVRVEHHPLQVVRAVEFPAASR